MVKSIRKLHEKHWMSHSVWMILLTVIIMLIVSIGIKEYEKIDKRIKSSELNSLKIEERIDEVEVHFLSEQKVLVDKISELETKLINTENNVQKLNEDLRKEKVRRASEKKNKQVKESVKKANEVDKVVKSGGVNLGVFKVSHYTAYCKGCTGKTKTGVNVKNTIYHQGMRVIAVDPRLIPLNSIVEINDNGSVYRAIAVDTGGLIKGRKLDLLVGSKGEASRLGVKNISVKLIQSGK